MNIMAKNYHTILGISPGAGREEIKAAYRRLAKQYHPDHDGGDTEKFKNIQEAYSMLTGDPGSAESKGSPGRYASHRTGQKGIRVRVRTRPSPKSANRRPGAEPLIPERDPVRVWRGLEDRPYTMDDPETDLFDWIFRRLF